MAVGEPVHGDHGLVAIGSAGEVERGAQRGGARDVADGGDLAAEQPVAVDHQTRVRPQAAAGDGD